MVRNSAQGHGMKSDEKPFFLSNLCDCLRKMVHIVIERYFFFISGRFEDFS